MGVRWFAEQDGSTALHFAARQSSVDVIQLLLEARADSTIRNAMGRTPMEAAQHEFGITPILIEQTLLGQAVAENKETNNSANSASDQVHAGSILATDCGEDVISL